MSQHPSSRTLWSLLSQIAMQNYLTEDVTTLVLPPASVSLTPTSPTVAAGGSGRVYQCELLQTVVTLRGEQVAKGTPVVRLICSSTVVLKFMRALGRCTLQRDPRLIVTLPLFHHCARL